MHNWTLCSDSSSFFAAAMPWHGAIAFWCPPARAINVFTGQRKLLERLVGDSLEIAAGHACVSLGKNAHPST